MYFLSPASVPGLREPKRLLATLSRDREEIGRTLREVATRMMSEVPTAFERQKEEYNVTTREELVEKLMESVENFMDRMQWGIEEKIPLKQAQKLDFTAKKIIAAKKLEEGPRKVLLTEMKKAVGELNTMFGKYLGGSGVEAIGEFQLYKLREDWKKGVGKPSDFTAENLLKGDKDAQLEFDKLKELINDTSIKDGEFLNKTLEKLEIEPYREMFSKVEVEKDPGLRALLVALSSKAWDKKSSELIPQGFEEALEALYKAKLGLKPKELTGMFERIRVDFAVLNGNYDTLKELFGEDVAKVLAKTVSFIELKSVLDSSNKDQFIKYTNWIGANLLVGIAGLVKPSFKQFVPKIKTAMVNIMSGIKKLFPEEFSSEEALKETARKKIESGELTSEMLKNTISKILEDAGLKKEAISTIIDKLDGVSKDLQKKKTDVSKVGDNF